MEAVFSFLFGDGNPNYNLEERRWQEIATVIKNNKGAVIAEQIAPYLDDIGNSFQQENEEYMLPVLTRFNGRPEVSPEGQIVYYFPELQTTAKEYQIQPVSSYLKEQSWRFSEANSGQLILAAGLGAVNLVGALMLGSLLSDPQVALKIGGLVAFVDAIYPLLFAYGISFLTVPLVRYFWIQWRNQKLDRRNEMRENRLLVFSEPERKLQMKIAYASQFAAENVIGGEDLAYTTERELLDQEAERGDKIDAEWQRRLSD
ncbi:MAG: hypothetical protein F6K35_46845 [Okeania sp. SIO2H7]|nr:hypothetical protein [Okeania sp. SIO2H7]